MNTILKTTFASQIDKYVFMAYSFVISSETTYHNTTIFVFYSGDKNCDFAEIKVILAMSAIILNIISKILQNNLNIDYTRNSTDVLMMTV